MNAADASRVVALTARIQTIQRVLELLEGGATITAMTLHRRPISPLSRMAPRAGDGEPSEPNGANGAEPGMPEPGEPPTVPGPDEPESIEPIPAPLAEPEGPSVGDVTISTEGLVYPPQMLTAIRQQELAMWRSTYEELERLGVTNVPAPPA